MDTLCIELLHHIGYFLSVADMLQWSQVYHYVFDQTFWQAYHRYHYSTRPVAAPKAHCMRIYNQIRTKPHHICTFASYYQLDMLPFTCAHVDYETMVIVAGNRQVSSSIFARIFEKYEAELRFAFIADVMPNYDVCAYLLAYPALPLQIREILELLQVLNLDDVEVYRDKYLSTYGEGWNDMPNILGADAVKIYMLICDEYDTEDERMLCSRAVYYQATKILKLLMADMVTTANIEDWVSAVTAEMPELGLSMYNTLHQLVELPWVPQLAAMLTINMRKALLTLPIDANNSLLLILLWKYIQQDISDEDIAAYVSRVPGIQFDECQKQYLSLLVVKEIRATRLIAYDGIPLRSFVNLYLHTLNYGAPAGEFNINHLHTDETCLIGNLNYLLYVNHNGLLTLTALRGICLLISKHPVSLADGRTVNMLYVRDANTQFTVPQGDNEMWAVSLGTDDLACVPV